MSVRKPIARTTVSDYVTTCIDGVTFRLSYQSTLYGKSAGDRTYDVPKSALYNQIKKLAKEAIRRGIVGKIDRAWPTLNQFQVIRENGVWYQLQTPGTDKDNLILPDFRETKTYKDIEYQHSLTLPHAKTT